MRYRQLTKYDNLDPRTELEQIIAEDLKKALEKRGLNVHHNGSHDSPAKGGASDIDVVNDEFHINVEVTKLMNTAADHEYASIEDHLTKSKSVFGKKTYVMYVSPETPRRIIHLIKVHNQTNSQKLDMKILPLSFANFDLIVNALSNTHKDLYPIAELIDLFSSYEKFDGDIEILKVIQAKLFPSDDQLRDAISKKEEEKHQETVHSLVEGLETLAHDLRKKHIATSTNAIRNVIYLVFIKLFEEKQEHDSGLENRFTKEGFLSFQRANHQEKTKRAIHLLFTQITKNRDLEEAQMFDSNDRLANRLNDTFVLKYFIEPFEEYQFYKEKIDGLGAAYEVLGKLSGKDVIVGQFFTPENVVRFMVKLAELDPENVVLDPACGTARYLIKSMEDMVNKVQDRPDKKAKEKGIKKAQLFGDDHDTQVAKLAKMNMYIHGDGKTNILDQDGLLLFQYDNKIDVILTNPPLGDVSYTMEEYDSPKDGYRLMRMVTIPRRNLTAEKLTEAKEKLATYQVRLSQTNESKNQADINKLSKRVSFWLDRIGELEYKIRSGNIEYKITGSEMKGGSLFLTASKYYLKSVRNPDDKIEWRGGKLLIILDEGILNDTRYKPVRDFLKKNFYIKAIISLTRDTFIPVSKTSTKTSILYAIKKEDPNAVQQEPVFYAHANKVGVDTRRRVIDNDLDNEMGDSILKRFFDFKKKVHASYIGERFSKTEFEKLGLNEGILKKGIT